jgi:hypothetical protein
MTEFENKRFSVKTGGRSPADCSHGWIAHFRCIFCGTQIPEDVVREQYVRWLTGREWLEPEGAHIVAPDGEQS